MIPEGRDLERAIEDLDPEREAYTTREEFIAALLRSPRFRHDIECEQCARVETMLEAELKAWESLCDRQRAGLDVMRSRNDRLRWALLVAGSLAVASIVWGLMR